MKSLLIFGLICQLAYCANEYPDYLKKFVCKGSDKDYSDCMLRKFRNVIPYYVKGIPELNIPSIDPFRIPQYSLNASIFDFGRFQIIFKNIVVRGLGNTDFHSVKADLKYNTLEVSATIPWLYTQMKYKIDGHFLLIPISVEGDFTGNITNIQILHKSNAKTIKKDGIEYFKLDKISPKISIGGGKININTSDQDLQPTVKMLEQMFNDDPRTTFNIIKPMIIDHFADFVRQHGDEFLGILPVSEFVPE